MNLLSMNRLYAPVAFIAIILGGCTANQPIPEVSQPQGSAVMIDLTLKAPTGIVSNKPTQIYFARIDGEEGLLQQQIIRSNYVKDGRAYLLNALPGTYVAVGAFFTQFIQPSTATYRTYFSKELVEHTKVAVREGEFSFMGSYVVDESWGLDGADEVQTHYNNLIAPGAPTSVFITSFTRDYHYRGILRERKADDKTRNEFLQKAKDDLAGSGWVARIK